MDERGKPPSLRDFDYFGDTAAASDAGADTENRQEEDGDAPISSRWGPRQRAVVTALTTLMFLGVSLWFMWGYWDAARYAFMSPQEPLMLGDVSQLTPDQIQHNSYVTIHGITEHRGMRQEAVRGLSLSRHNYWYFRLLGSRGVFIEVEPDKERYGFTTEVTVSGRAIDPQRAPMYRDLLRSYADLFATENRAQTRIIQVDVKPGENRGVYMGAVGVLGCLALANVAAFARLVRSLL